MVWLEDLTEPGHPGWPISRYRLAARHLGRFNGAYLAGWPLPRAPWLSRGFWGAVLDHHWRSWQAVADDAHAWEHPLVRPLFPAGTAHRLRRLCGERARVFAVLRHLPRTFCHQDTFRRNLLSRRAAAASGEETVAIDWAFAGIDAVGVDAGQLVASSLFFGEVAPGQAPELDAAVYEGYVAGLRDAGWRGDARLARLGMAFPTLRWGLTAARSVVRSVAAAQGATGAAQPSDDPPLAARMASRAAVARFLLDRSDELSNPAARPARQRSVPSR